MSNQTVHRRYATALYDEAGSANIVDRVDEDAEFLQQSIAEHRNLAQLFDSPVVSQDRKQAVVNALFEDRLHPLTLRFVNMIVRKEREGELNSILQAYQKLRDEEAGVVEVQVQVARPLDAKGEAALTRRLENVVGSSVRLNTTVKPELVGGLIVRIGDVVYNGSVQHHLKSLRERMRQGASNGARTAANGNAAA